MSSSNIVFDKNKHLLVLTYAPAGLGHLRVVNAFHNGLPEDSNPVILGASDTSLTLLHRITSIHPFFRKVFEWVQRGAPQTIFTRMYRPFIRRRSTYLAKLFMTAVNQQSILPETCVVISTHFSLSHQIGELKHELEKKLRMKIVLVVIVTDDSPQYIWYTPGADLICVPSEYTKDELIAYGKQEGLDKVKIKVFPYAVSPTLGKILPDTKKEIRDQQYKKQKTSPIHVSVPVSGAAVGLDFSLDLMKTLHRKSKRFMFHVVSKAASYTKDFLHQVEQLSYVEVHVGIKDREVVGAYDEMFTKHTIGFEITKPSEQAFKAMFLPKHVGGSFMLLTTPVGRQEYDNIAFLRRHNLLPSSSLQQELWEYSYKNTSINDKQKNELPSTIRSFLLPQNSTNAAVFILWCINQELFSTITHKQEQLASDNKELGIDGVAQVWDYVSSYIQS